MVAWVLADTAQGAARAGFEGCREGIEAEDEECHDDDLVTNDDFTLHDDGFWDIDTRMSLDKFSGVGDLLPTPKPNYSIPLTAFVFLPYIAVR